MNERTKKVRVTRQSITRTAWKHYCYGLFIYSFYYKMRSKHNG